LTLVGPRGAVLANGYAGTPVVPLEGLAFARPVPADLPATVAVGGMEVGVAAIGDAEAAIPRYSDRGAGLVLLTGGPVGEAQLERLAAAARAGRVALLIAGRCAGTPFCIDSAAVDPDGRIDRNGASGHTFAGLQRRSPPGARGLRDPVPQPARWDYSPALAELGRLLFFDKRLSERGAIACSSCHDPSRGFTDGRAVGAGVAGRSTGRNTLSLLNVAYRPALRWDAYPSSLENFVKYPLSGHEEMDSHRLDTVLRQIGRAPLYRAQFSRLFKGERLRFEQIEQALAAYMRTLVSGDSAFDRATSHGRSEAMSEAAWRGFDLFKGRAGCAGCHAYSGNSPFFTDLKLHNTGLGRDAPAGSFRTPTLRDVGRTGPYMHDGSIATLRGVIDFFDGGGGNGPGRDPALRPLHLSERDKQDLEAFLVALTGTTSFDSAGRRTDRPLAPLPPGGDPIAIRAAGRAPAP
jgi:cytochrome c peroxidase